MAQSAGGEKNAILIVEFAPLTLEGARALEAEVVEACRLLRQPILMMAPRWLAFIAGVVPIVIASGAE
nr:efflux RND transporter permease subunit [Pseudomonas aeruginosa]